MRLRSLLCSVTVIAAASTTALAGTASAAPKATNAPTVSMVVTNPLPALVGTVTFTAKLVHPAGDGITWGVAFYLRKGNTITRTLQSHQVGDDFVSEQWDTHLWGNNPVSVEAVAGNLIVVDPTNPDSPTFVQVDPVAPTRSGRTVERVRNPTLTLPRSASGTADSVITLHVGALRVHAGTATAHAVECGAAPLTPADVPALCDLSTASTPVTYRTTTGKVTLWYQLHATIVDPSRTTEPGYLSTDCNHSCYLAVIVDDLATDTDHLVLAHALRVTAP